VISEFVDQNGYPEGLPSAMIRRGDWKLWIHQDEDGLPPVLFNLREDPDETSDLGEDPGYKTVRNDLIGELLSRWDPGDARNGSRKMSEAYDILCSWGRKVEPESGDALPVPSPELEANVRLL
jgi:arylsulfatase A-like enzyme